MASFCLLLINGFKPIFLFQPLIVDVRTEDEFAAGRIPGAVNIPLSEVHIINLCFALDEFKKHTTRIYKKKPASQVEFAFSLPEKKFMETFGISKPGMADLIITSCKVTAVKTFNG